jgi:PhzF family phenazine biosynthesis protein
MRQWTVDAFAAQPFRGNQACVLEPMAGWPDAAWMQTLAAENNQAETAFLLKTADPSRFGLRWFTPALEVPLCGHATLASGHVLLSEIGITTDLLTFDTKSGPLTVRRSADAYEMDFPAQPPQRVETPAGLAAALGVEPQEVWASAYLVAVLKDEAEVHACTPISRLWRRFPAPPPAGAAMSGSRPWLTLAGPMTWSTASSPRVPAFRRIRPPARCTAS